MFEQISKYMYRLRSVLQDINIGLIFEIIINIIIISVIFKFLDIFENSIKEKMLERDKNTQMYKITHGLIGVLKFIIFFVMLASFLQTHGYSVSSLIAGFGITGLAVGLAANATLSNIFGTISIISDKTFMIGDYIKVKEFEGTVEEINMRSSKIRTLDNALTIIPNSVIANAEVVNISAAHRKRIFETIGVTYDTSHDKLEQAVKIIENILNNMPEISKDYIVNIDKLDNSSINIRVNAYVKTKIFNNYLKIKEKFLLELIKQYRESGIEFAFPSQTIYLSEGTGDEN